MKEVKGPSSDAGRAIVMAKITSTRAGITYASPHKVASKEASEPKSVNEPMRGTIGAALGGEKTTG